MIYGIKGGGGGGGDLKNQLTQIVIRNSPSREAPPPTLLIDAELVKHPVEHALLYV